MTNKDKDCGCGTGLKSQDTEGAHKFDPVKNNPKMDQKKAPEQGQSKIG